MDRVAISLAISSRVFPSVVIPRDFAATIRGSRVAADGADAGGGDVEGGMYVDGDVSSFDAFSNSRFARPMDLAISGSFCGPHKKMTTSITTTLMASNPTSAKFASHVKCAVSADIRMMSYCEV